MVVDSHTHVASSDTARYPLRPTGVGSTWFQAGGDVERLLAAMDEAHVDRAVLVQAIGAYGYDCSYGRDAVAVAPDRLVFVGAVDMNGPDPVADLDALGPVAGLRPFGVGADEPVWLTDGRAAAVWDAAAERDLTLVPCLWGRDLPKLRPLVEARPGVPVALDHCGFPDLAGGPPYAGAATLFDLADLPAVHLKVSTHVLEPLDDLAAFIDTLAERFGPTRLCWGSDYPQTHSLTYPAMVELGRRAARNLDAAGADAFLGGTAVRLWM